MKKEGHTIHLKVRTFLHITNHARASAVYIQVDTQTYGFLLVGSSDKNESVIHTDEDSKYLADYRGCVRQSGFRKFHKTALSPTNKPPECLAIQSDEYYRFERFVSTCEVRRPIDNFINLQYVLKKRLNFLISFLSCKGFCCFLNNRSFADLWLSSDELLRTATVSPNFKRPSNAY